MPVVLERFSVVWPARDETPLLATQGTLRVRRAWTEDRTWLEQTMRERWDGRVVSRGQLQYPDRLPALIAVDEADHRVGVLTFRPRPGVDTEVVTLDALEPHRGIGHLLTRSRELKPSIPLRSLDGIPIRHELELEFPLG